MGLVIFAVLKASWGEPPKWLKPRHRPYGDDDAPLFMDAVLSDPAQTLFLVFHLYGG